MTASLDALRHDDVASGFGSRKPLALRADLPANQRAAAVRYLY